VNIRERLLSKIKFAEGPIAGSPCWLFVGSLNNSGYGYLTHGGWPEGTHRLSWQLARGPIPDGMWVCHRCDVPSCCNVDHLFLGNPQDNVADMIAKGRAAWSFVGGATIGEPIKLRRRV